ncbi:MAG: hypothetical protein JNM50_10475 [Chromatiales bacterium]|jgi:hypothetical protein|nr:hypothetical protein [Chromatiales bacterium]
MNPLDRIVGPTLPANRLRRVEDRRREKSPRDQRPAAPAPEPQPGRPKPADDGSGRSHHIDELA